MQPNPIRTSPELRCAVQNAEEAIHALREAGMSDRADKLEQHVLNARKLRFTVGVVAQAKRGKSTLINGLLGQSDDRLAPVGFFPATNVVSCFANGSDHAARIILSHGDSDSPGRPISYDSIKDYACEEFNPGNRKEVKLIEVIGDFPLLGQDVVLVDTPGADNALTNTHDLMLFEFLPKLDVVIFLVTADAPLVEAEMRLLSHIRKNDVRKLLFAINKVDTVTPDELMEGLVQNRKMLTEAGFSDAPIFEISAKTFHEKSSDHGTERLITAMGRIIGEGRAETIASRLGELTNSMVREASEEARFELENAELTTEQINKQRAELQEIRTKLEDNRESMEGDFRAAWRGAFNEFETALQPIQKKMTTEYGELIENASAGKLKNLGEMIHTDVVKRLDELLEPDAEKLSESIGKATQTLQVATMGSMGISARDAEAILTRKQALSDAMSTGLAGAPALAGAALVGTLPGLVSSAILSTAPGVAAAVWYNPFTWVAAAATGVANGAISAVAASVATVLAPIAIIGTPLLVGYAGLQVFSTWRHQVDKSRNELSIAVKDLIIKSIDETLKNLKLARDKDTDILSEFKDFTKRELDSAMLKLDELERNRPSQERLIELKMASRTIGRLSAPEHLTDSDKPQPKPTERLFK